MLENEIIEKFQRNGYLNLSREIFLSNPIDKVFKFFSDAGNLDILTPKWLNFSILTDMPISISKDTQIDYKLKYRGFPIKWTSNINEWDPPYFLLMNKLKDRIENGFIFIILNQKIMELWLQILFFIKSLEINKLILS